MVTYLVKQVADSLSDNPRVAKSLQVYELNNTHSTLYDAFGVRAIDVTFSMSANGNNPLSFTPFLFDSVTAAVVLLFEEIPSTPIRHLKLSPV